MKNCIKYLLIASVLMMVGSSVGDSLSSAELLLPVWYPQLSASGLQQGYSLSKASAESLLNKRMKEKIEATHNKENVDAHRAEVESVREILANEGNVAQMLEKLKNNDKGVYSYQAVIDALQKKKVPIGDVMFIANEYEQHKSARSQ
jgi:hypothetical protein